MSSKGSWRKAQRQTPGEETGPSPGLQEAYDLQEGTVSKAAGNECHRDFRGDLQRGPSPLLCRPCKGPVE